MSEVNVEAVSMLAASLGINSDENKSVDTSVSGQQLDGGRRGQWGDLWQ